MLKYLTSINMFGMVKRNETNICYAQNYKKGGSITRTSFLFGKWGDRYLISVHFGDVYA